MASSDDMVVYATTDEVQLAIAALGAGDLVRLTRIAQIRCAGLPGIEWSDLLQDAISRALDGSRRWPRHISLVVFLREVMRSLASEIRRRQHREVSLPKLDDPEAGARDAWQNVASLDPDPERRALARNMLDKVERIFADDPRALAVFRGLADGLSPDQIQEEAAMSARDYDSTRRRIRRALARNFPESL